MIGENVSTIIKNIRKEVRGNNLSFTVFIMAQNGSGNSIQLHIHIKIYFLLFPVNHLVQFVSAGGNGLMPFKRLFRVTFPV